MAQSPRLYAEFAAWWPLVSPPGEYVEEAADVLARLEIVHTGPRRTMLELGSGGGSLACHLKSAFTLTLTDISVDMLRVNKDVNPECEHIEGDMRTLRLDREFDIVLVHDAVMYMTTEHDLGSALRTAAVHCRPEGTVVILPDFVKETFTPDTGSGGLDGPDGRAIRYMDWTWDPDPADNTYLVDYAYMFRKPDGQVTVEHERHIEGLFAREKWLELCRAAGIQATSSIDAWGRDVFFGRRTAASS